MPYYDTGDAAIHYDITGNGPPLVMLHGYALNSLMWEFQIPEFAKSNTVFSVDLRGFGKSSCGQEWSGNVMADDIIGLIKSLGLENVAIMGFSLSGPAAFRAAHSLPGIVTGLVMVSSILPSKGRPRAEKESRRHDKEMEILRLRGPRAWAEATGLESGPLVSRIFKVNPQARPVWERIFERHNPDYLLGMMKARQNSSSLIDWRSRLGEITQQTLIVNGEEDTKFIDGANYLQRTIPNSELRVIEGAGHMVNLEKPEEFNSVIMDFLSG